MKKLALLWLTAIALMFSAGGSVGATHGMGGSHGQGGFHDGHGVVDQRRFMHRDFDGRHHFNGVVDQRRFMHRDFDGHHHFHGHADVIIGVPIFEPPIYYPSPVYIEQGSYYLYYCPDPSGYYPDIQSCSQEWLLVVPEAPPQ